MCRFLYLQITGHGGKVQEFSCFESRHQFLIDMYFDACYYITTGAREAVQYYLPESDEDNLWKLDDPKALFERALDFREYALREWASIENAWRSPSHDQLMAGNAPPKAIR